MGKVNSQEAFIRSAFPAHVTFIFRCHRQPCAIIISLDIVNVVNIALDYCVFLGRRCYKYRMFSLLSAPPCMVSPLCPPSPNPPLCGSDMPLTQAARKAQTAQLFRILGINISILDFGKTLISFICCMMDSWMREKKFHFILNVMMCLKVSEWSLSNKCLDRGGSITNGGLLPTTNAWFRRKTNKENREKKLSAQPGNN